MKYNRNLTSNHPLSLRYPHFLEEINKIISDEGVTQQNFSDEVALKLDSVKTASGDRDISRLKSMDMIIVLNNTRGNDPQTLLIDFKLRCNGIRSISSGDCIEKIKDSKLLLFGSGIPINNRYIFIFNDKLIQQFRSLIIRNLQNPFAGILTIDEFRNEYF